ncbi:MNIO family bufferin maturase [Massilia putida]|uniref:MNIO family bufferin maturase n=1 Tax=Massilia putida TaxID=1141883 RepID=UPI0009FADEE1|nr:DUF692 domain-containing protein [Massilia putida]
MKSTASPGALDSGVSAPALALALPRRAGIGLKPEHFQHILAIQPDIGFFEIHAENYMVDGGPLHHYLSLIRECYPLSIHGVGLSLGGEAPPDVAHLDRLKMLIERYAPQSFSEHLAWTSHGNVFFNDLLPVAYDRQTLQRVCSHIDQVQAHLDRKILLENPATYVEFATSTMTEAEFIGEILVRTGCGLLLDVNNLYVSSINHDFNPYAAVRALPLEEVGEIHIAGFERDLDGNGDELLIDSHGAPVTPAVWQLYKYVLDRAGPVPTLLERDNNIPSFDVLLNESRMAELLLLAAERVNLHQGAGA